MSLISLSNLVRKYSFYDIQNELVNELQILQESEHMELCNIIYSAINDINSDKSYLLSDLDVLEYIVFEKSKSDNRLLIKIYNSEDNNIMELNQSTIVDILNSNISIDDDLIDDFSPLFIALVISTLSNYLEINMANEYKDSVFNVKNAIYDNPNLSFDELFTNVDINKGMEVLANSIESDNDVSNDDATSDNEYVSNNYFDGENIDINDNEEYMSKDDEETDGCIDETVDEEALNFTTMNVVKEDDKLMDLGNVNMEVYNETSNHFNENVVSELATNESLEEFNDTEFNLEDFGDTELIDEEIKIIQRDYLSIENQDENIKVDNEFDFGDVELIDEDIDIRFRTSDLDADNMSDRVKFVDMDELIESEISASNNQNISFNESISKNEKNYLDESIPINNDISRNDYPDINSDVHIHDSISSNENLSMNDDAHKKNKKLSLSDLNKRIMQKRQNL